MSAWKRASLNLLRDPSIRVVHRRRPTCFFIVGERCSGTNVLRALLERNTELYLSNEYGWKHGFPMFSAVSAEAIAFVIFRNAIDWLRSMYGKPWHTTETIRRMSFREFVRCRWDAIVDVPAHFALPDGDSREGEILQYDRHPITGRAFTDILELRKVKLAAHLGMWDRDINVVLCTYEYISEEPQAFVETVGRAFGISFVKPVSLSKARFGWPWPKETRDVDLPPVGLEAEDRAYVLSRLDLALEGQIGYCY